MATEVNIEQVTFEAGCYAWARMRGFPWWPCVVFNDMKEVPPELKKKTAEGLKPKPHEVVCLFLDSFTYSLVEKKDVRAVHELDQDEVLRSAKDARQKARLKAAIDSMREELDSPGSSNKNNKGGAKAGSSNKAAKRKPAPKKKQQQYVEEEEEDVRIEAAADMKVTGDVEDFHQAAATPAGDPAVGGDEENDPPANVLATLAQLQQQQAPPAEAEEVTAPQPEASKEEASGAAAPMILSPAAAPPATTTTTATTTNKSNSKAQSSSSRRQRAAPSVADDAENLLGPDVKRRRRSPSALLAADILLCPLTGDDDDRQEEEEEESVWLTIELEKVKRQLLDQVREAKARSSRDLQNRVSSLERQLAQEKRKSQRLDAEVRRLHGAVRALEEERDAAKKALTDVRNEGDIAMSLISLRS